MDTLLGKLDEFEQLMVLSQSDANVCLFKHVPGLQTKFTEMQSVFDKIDRYEFLSISYVFLKFSTYVRNCFMNEIFLQSIHFLNSAG